MIDEIKRLEIIARNLEAGADRRSELFGITRDYVESFLKELPGCKTFYSAESKAPQMSGIPFCEEPAGAEKVFTDLKEVLEGSGINTASGGHLGFIPGSGLFESSLADLIADVLNCYAGIQLASPGAVKIENSLLEWMASLIGYPSSSKGNLTPGGSVSNLIAAVTAREAFKLTSSTYKKAVVYLTAQTHHSFEKALRIAGMQECVKHYIAMDENFRMNTSFLRDEIKKDKKAGLIPWMIIATAGTTDVGAVDPLEDIGKTASQEGVWYHIDGAYGALFVLSESGRKLLKGMELSDSIIMDPHKSLFLPFGTGAVLIKNGKLLYDAHKSTAGYMQDALNENSNDSPADLSPELTKHFRGLRLWLPLMLIGIKPFRAALEEKLLLTRYAYYELRKIPGIRTGNYPQLSVITFRYLNPEVDADKYNRRLLNEILKDGRIFLSSTVLNGNFTLRMAVLSFRTHLAEIDLALNIIKDKIDKINSSSILMSLK